MPDADRGLPVASNITSIFGRGRLGKRRREGGRRIRFASQPTVGRPSRASVRGRRIDDHAHFPAPACAANLRQESTEFTVAGKISATVDGFSSGRTGVEVR